MKNLRAQGLVPATIYGPKRVSENIQIDRREASKIFKEVSFNQFFDLELEGEKSVKALFKEVTIHPIKNEVQNIGFYQIDEDSKISVDVPINFVGEAPAVKQNLGFLVTSMDTVKVHCFPKDLPSGFEVDLNSLENVGDTVQISTLVLPKDVEFDSTIDENSAIVYIAAAQKQEVEVVAAPVEGELNEDGTPKVAAEGEAVPAVEGEKKE